MDYQLGEKIVTKKKHPCGNDVWEIVRIGADFKIKCLKCEHVVMLDRQVFLKSVKKKVE